MTIWFDMDGTLADLYSIENWLQYLNNEDTTPYRKATPLLNMSLLARYLNKLVAQGYEIGIISWGSKYSTEQYFKNVQEEKIRWIKKHLPSVNWTHIIITKYGVNKFETTGGGILFDDEITNRNTWGENAYEPYDIFSILKELVK